MKVINDPDSMKNPKLLEATMNGYDENNMEINNVLTESRDNFRKGFVLYMKSVENVNLKDSEIDDAMDYLHGHLQSEVGLWTEDDVKDKLKDWKIAQTPATPATPPTPPTPPSPYTPQTPPAVSPSVLKQKRDNATERVSQSANLKDAIKKLIDNEDSYIIDILLKYV